MEFKKYSIEGFIKDLSSDSEAPGGGSTSALVLALAGSLNGMVYSLTVGKKSFQKLIDEDKEKMKSFQSETEKFIETSIELMEEDSRAFKALMEGYRLPKDLEDRGEKIQELTFNAMNAPFEMAKLGIKFYENIKFAAQYGNKGLITDAGVGGILLDSAINASILNVKVNLKYFKDETLKEEIKNKISEIMIQSKKEMNEILKIVNEEIE
ncbi:cyclodeaminase/cyclohydrolase family protein [uncultured Clostridium sp.]|uniref:cyclodeaminase/cyclohydrolase family protein n=1 Tax=uncultured Clostridium sp. TaxID=59620 RepID=UPI002602EA85|nr:cyclodeaminase/cyclohydrolase family protein [uncultured Clostridium sp.]